MPPASGKRSAKATPASTPSTGPAKPGTAAVADIARPRPRRQLSRDAIKQVQARMRDVDHGGRTFEWMLHTLLKRHHDLVDPAQIEAQAKRPQFPETCSKCIGNIALHSIRALRSGQPLDDAAKATHVAAVKDMHSAAPCPAIADIIDSVVAEERAKHGAFLLQDPYAVVGQIELQLVFDSPSTTKRMKRFKEQCPAAVSKIKQFLCGPGFHSAPPKASNDDAWTSLMSRLKFDAIRDNRTPIYTELSKHWKKRHTPFEQFAHFLAFRESLPAHFTLNMLTHGQKPALVAALCGDTTAFVLLARLGFAIPSDIQWERTPFLRDSLDTRRHAVLRHLNTYFYRRQFKNPAPIVVQTLMPPPPSGFHGHGGHNHGRSPGMEPMPTIELPPTLAGGGLPPNHPAMRVWEPRPPRKNDPAAASASATTTGHNGSSNKSGGVSVAQGNMSVAGGTRRSPIHDSQLAATLPDISPAAKPASAGGANSSVSSWAAIATRTNKEGSSSAATSPQHTGGSLPRSTGVTPAHTPAKQPTPAQKPQKPAQAADSKKPAPAKKAAAGGTTKQPDVKPDLTPKATHTDPAAAVSASGGYAAAARAPPKPSTTTASPATKPAASSATTAAAAAPKARAAGAGGKQAPAAQATPKSKPQTPVAKPAKVAAAAATTSPAPKLSDNAPALPGSAAQTPIVKPAAAAEGAETPGGKRKNAWGVRSA